ncbi:DUF456 domain-containing protein [Cellulomonas gilvus]|uniref:DUF456 domain-containing protein n=1 Tax=Cellulomonas gilvus (strain ATCC 13127 / NRRL B-14078) TaxID=593907 RepID=F8A016_CELGA|nr:DUF456 domain-containing protein [Cellulomonas gilvus]AEI11435.1 protein of unknown function DUF456 [Cellulomonas gilvus ATCC 13127]
MNGVGEVVVGLVVIVGLFGVVVQVLPGALLVLGAVVVWGVVTGGVTGWTVVVVSVLATAAAAVGKYLLAGRHLKRGGVPSSTLVWGGIAGVVGFFVIPVVGLFVGFIGGTYLAEWVRVREPRPAWRATVAALQATGLTILVELAGALVCVVAWAIGLAVA